MKLTITENQYKIIHSRLTYNEVLEEMVFKLSILTEDEERKPDMEWDFTEVKKDLDSSKLWVKTKEDVREYISSLKEKIKNLPIDLKKRILKYVLYSFLGLLSIKQIQNYLEPPLQQAVKKEKEVIKKLEDVKIRKSSENLKNHLRYEEGSIREKGQPVLTAYDLGDGAYTIGYGHAIFRGEDEGYDFLPKYKDIKPGKTSISYEDAERLLDDDIKVSEEIVNRILNDWEDQGIKPKLTQGMYDAMVSMAYNMGPKIREKQFLEAIKQGNMELAKKLILQTSSSLFDNFPGLKTRRENEAKMFV
jgi:GH24 family phage-related lysozyme (muramidase)